MGILRVALGAIRQRGQNIVPPSLFAFGADEDDFLSRHVNKVRDDGRRGRAVFASDADVPQVLTATLKGTDEEFVVHVADLQARLASQMQTVSRASDCVFAVIQTREQDGQSATLTLLKLDAVLEAARMSVEAGNVSLEVLKQLLPESGEVQKGLSWPDFRDGSQALLTDTNATNAAYFETAYQVLVSPRSVTAVKQVASAILRDVPLERRAAAFAAADELEGATGQVLGALAQNHPELGAAAEEMAESERPQGLVPKNKFASRRVVWRADGAKLEVPVDRSNDVSIAQVGVDWVWSIRLRSRPEMDV